MTTLLLLAASAVMLGVAGWFTWDGHHHMLRAEAAARQARAHADRACAAANRARTAADKARAARLATYHTPDEEQHHDSVRP